MGKNFEGGNMENRPVRIEDIGTAHREGVNLNAAQRHIETYQGSELDEDALLETHRIVRDLGELQSQYPDAPEIRDALAQLRNLVWKSEQTTQERASADDTPDVPNQEKLLKDLEDLMHPSK